MRLKRFFVLPLVCLASWLALPAAHAQQPIKPVQVDAPNVPGGKVVLVPRDQLRASPGTKTLRLPHTMRAALGEKTFAPPDTFDWATKNGKRPSLPMLGNDRYGNCYYVAPAKVHILFQWQVQGTQLTFDEKALIARYLKVSGGDNGLSDSQVFPEMKAGIIGPNGPYKSLDELIVPASDKAALRLAAWAFGAPMFTFTVYDNFMQVKPGMVMRGNAGRVRGGHAVLFSGVDDQGWHGETWGFPEPFIAIDQWIAGVDPEFVATFSLRWFNDKGYAPNGLHYTQLAPMWNSMGGNVSLVSPFPPPDNPPPLPPPPPPPPVGATYTLTYTYTADGRLVGPPVLNAAPVGPGKVSEADLKKLLDPIVDAKFSALFPGAVTIGGKPVGDWKSDLIAALIKALMEYLAGGGK